MPEIICPHCGESIEIEINMTENKPDHIEGHSLVANALLLWLDHIARNTNTDMIYTGSIKELYQDVTKFLRLKYSDPAEFGWYPTLPNRLIQIIKRNSKCIQNYGYRISINRSSVKIYRQWWN